MQTKPTATKDKLIHVKSDHATMNSRCGCIEYFLRRSHKQTCTHPHLQNRTCKWWQPYCCTCIVQSRTVILRIISCHEWHFTMVTRHVNCTKPTIANILLPCVQYGSRCLRDITSPTIYVPGRFEKHLWCHHT